MQFVNILQGSDCQSVSLLQATAPGRVFPLTPVHQIAERTNCRSNELHLLCMNVASQHAAGSLASLCSALTTGWAR